MSSYLTIYGIPKNEDKPIDIVSFSRSHCVYSAICDNVDVAWAGDNTSDLDRVIYNLEEDIKSSNQRLTMYEKYVLNNSEYIEDIISLKEYIEELTTSKNYCEFIQYIVSQADLGLSGFSQICCNVD